MPRLDEKSNAVILIQIRFCDKKIEKNDKPKEAAFSIHVL